jgi:hypothetical protein
MASATSGFTAITCQYDPAGNSDDATVPESAGAAVDFSPAAGCVAWAGCVVG